MLHHATKTQVHQIIPAYVIEVAVWERSQLVGLGSAAHSPGAVLVATHRLHVRGRHMPLLTSECCDDIMRRSKGSFFDLHIIQWMSWSTKENSTFKTEMGTKRAWTNSSGAHGLQVSGQHD